MLYIGVDLGTSAVKLLLMDESGKVLNIVSKEYPISFPKPGWSEQNPCDWWEQTVAGLIELTKDFDRSAVAGISFGGQMHGLVVLDENDNVIRPAILWNDGRTQKETDYLNNVIGKEKLSELTGNIAFAGFTAPKILWLKANEPENFARIKKLMLPKDYIAYRMTGTLKADVACELGFPKDCIVAAGAGDNAAAAIGTGTVGAGKCNLSLGTSGTLFITSDEFRVDSHNALHSFDHADGGYHLMGCMLSAASCNNWWMKDILHSDDFVNEQKPLEEDGRLGENHVYFLPYLMGERSPHNDPSARAAFIGMSMDTDRADMLQAVFEGVAYGLRDSLEVAKSLGVAPKSTTICGGGAKSVLWRKIVANVMNMQVDTVEVEEGPAYGGAILAAVANGCFENVEAAAAAIVRKKDTTMPSPQLVEKYEKGYAKFKQFYPALKGKY